jgi:two-component system LytT family response regulator
VIRCLLVDDEAPARDRLRELLSAHADVAVVGEAEDGAAALERAGELRPDLLFLDIQMPGATGLEVAASLAAPRPRIVFCTAFDVHAVDAFELEALDYLLKPVSRARLAETLARVRAVPASEAEAALARAARVARVPRLLARAGTRWLVVPVEDVTSVRSEGGLTLVRVAGREAWMQPALQDLEDRLDPEAFLRVSRQALVQLSHVAEVVPRPEGGAELVLRDGSRLPVSRRRLPALLARLAGPIG